MSAVVSARDVVSNLYDEDSDENESETYEDVVDDLNYDVYNLVARNYHPINVNPGENLEDVLLENITRAAQLIVKRVFECPIEKSEVGPIAVLPAETTKLPREKPVPEAAPDTKWERFAKEKGIQKKKRERMVFDEENQQWAPRFGYKRAKAGDIDMPVMEVKRGADPYADPWTAAREEKKLRVDKNKLAAEKNKERAAGKKFGRKSGLADGTGGALKGSGISIPSGVPVDISAKRGKGGASDVASAPSSASGSKKQLRGKESLKSALQMAQYSTQSLGRFDTMRAGEPAKKMKGKKQSFRDNMDSTGSKGSEKAIMKSQMRIVTDAKEKKANRVSNSIAQYEGILPDAPTNAFRQKKGMMKVKSAAGGGKSKGGKGGKK